MVRFHFYGHNFNLTDPIFNVTSVYGVLHATAKKQVGEKIPYNLIHLYRPDRPLIAVVSDSLPASFD